MKTPAIDFSLWPGDACFSPFSRWLSPVLRLPLLLFALFIRLWFDVQPLSLGISVQARRKDHDEGS
jgi:hypothetical protein